jgi:hypothetical protein
MSSPDNIRRTDPSLGFGFGCLANLLLVYPQPPARVHIVCFIVALLDGDPNNIECNVLFTTVAAGDSLIGW